MGQKINPIGLRLGILQEHRSKWFGKGKDYPRLILEDKKIRDHISAKYPDAFIVDIIIKRLQTGQMPDTKLPVDIVSVEINTAFPAKIYGNSNPEAATQQLSGDLEAICTKDRMQQNKRLPSSKHLPQIEILIGINGNKQASSASATADFLIGQLEGRIPFRVALKKTLERVNGYAKTEKLEGIKIEVSGRLNGAEIARSEWIRKGRVPLQTLRADIDYSAKTAKTIYGILGVKVWAFKGERT